VVAGNDLDLAAFVGGVCGDEIGRRLPRGVTDPGPVGAA